MCFEVFKEALASLFTALMRAGPQTCADFEKSSFECHSRCSLVKYYELEAAQHVALLIQLTRQESDYGGKQGTPEDSLDPNLPLSHRFDHHLITI